MPCTILCEGIVFGIYVVAARTIHFSVCWKVVRLTIYNCNVIGLINYKSQVGDALWKIH